MLSSKNRELHFITIGICLSLLGLFCALYWDLIINRMTEQSLVLRPNAKFTKLWENPPMLMKFDFYMFNWTNSEMYLNTSIKPKMEEVGPYSFLEVPEKYNIKWHTENSTVSYRRRSRFFFDESSSGGKLNDTIVTINSLAVALTTRIRFMEFLPRMAAEVALNVYHNNIQIRRSVDELLFNGFDDQLLTIASNIPSAISRIKIPFDKFGYLYPRNTSTYGNDYNVNTGADDIRKIGQVNYWNHYNVTDYYESSCAKIQGSAGEFQAPDLKKRDPIEVFVPEFCRPIRLFFEEETWVEGILGYKYVGGLHLVDNGTLFKENRCHCNGECLRSGVVNVTSCWFDHPLFVSYPHFYQADPWFAEQFDGMHADKNLHELYIVLEPKSSLILDIGGRVQTNLYVEPLSAQKLFRRNNSLMFPLMWLNTHVKITPDLVAEIKTIHAYIHYGQWVGAICCIFGLLITSVLFFRYYTRRPLKCAALEAGKEHAMQRDEIKCLYPEISAFIKEDPYKATSCISIKPSLPSSCDSQCCTPSSSSSSSSDYCNCT